MRTDCSASQVSAADEPSAHSFIDVLDCYGTQLGDNCAKRGKMWWILGVPMICRVTLRKSGDVCKASREVRTSSYIDLVYSADSQG